MWKKEKNMSKKKIMLLMLGAVLAVGMTACGIKDAVMPAEEIKETETVGEVAEEAAEGPSEDMVVSFYGTLDETFLPFFNALQEQFPEVELRYEFQWDIPGVYEMERRILHEDGPDLAVVTGAALNSLTEKDLLFDLTNTSFSTKYHVSTMAALNDEGRVLGLPLPNDLRCLITNRGILEENGVTELPKSVPELIEICKILSEKGQGAVIADGHIYSMLLRTSFLNRPSGYDWLQEFNKGENVMEGTPAADAWESFAELAAVSGCNREDASAQPAARTEMMLSGKYAFRCVTISNLRFMQEENSELDLIALPLLGETEEDQWAFYAEKKNMRYFVANKALAQPGNEDKQEVVLRMLEWISTDEAQQTLGACSSATISYVNDVELQQGDIMEFMNPVIQQGRLTGSDILERGVEDVLSECAAMIVEGEMTYTEAIAACDTQNREYVPEEEIQGLDEVVGTAAEPIYWRKPVAVTVGSPMTQLAAVAMAEAFPEADFAFAMAKNAASTLYPGEVTMKDVLACAEGEGDSELALVQATGEQIKTLIDAGVGSPAEATLVVPYGIAGKGRLLHPAGLTYKADISRDAGDKITELALTDGGELDMDKTYTVIVSSLLIDGVTEPNLTGCEIAFTGKYLKDVLAEYIRANEVVSSPELAFEIIGAEPLYTLP